jgi:hypothetical protein
MSLTKRVQFLRLLNAGTSSPGVQSLILLVLYVASRALYYVLGVRFDSDPLQSSYWQCIDPKLLREEFLQSIFYLKEQMPGFNIYLGTILHLFPHHSQVAFHLTYLCLGAILTICLFDLMNRMHINRLIAFCIVGVFIVDPGMVLYENWLFYEYPLAVLFCVATLFLHRYASAGRNTDGFLLFSSLAAMGSLRVFYHLTWFCVIVFLLLYALPWKRKTIYCAALPGAFLLLLYAKTFALFGELTPGSDVYGGINLAGLTTQSLPHATLRKLVDSGKVSPVIMAFGHCDSDSYLELWQTVPLPPKSGIRILDEVIKSSGPPCNFNMESLWMGNVGKQLHQDGSILLREYPRVALRTIRSNVRRYFLPADSRWPFTGGERPNKRVLSFPLEIYDLLLTGKSARYDHAVLSYLVLPSLLCFGIREIGRRFKGACLGSSCGLTLLFVVGNIVYLTAVVVVFAEADQNRFRFEVSALYALLFGLLASALWRRLRNMRSLGIWARSNSAAEDTLY